MTLLALDAIQPALYNKLTGDGVLMGMITGVYDIPPHQATLPYVILGDGQTQELPQVSSLVTECTMNIHVWTNAAGRKTVLAILSRIYGLLHQGTISPAGLTVLGMHCDQAETQMDPQDDRVEGMLRVVITVME